MLSTKRGGTGRHGQVSRSCAALIAIVATLVCQACESVNPVNSFDAQLISTNAPPLASVGRLAVIGGSVSSQVVAILDLDEQRQVGFLGFNAVVAAIALHPLDRSLWLSFARSPVGPFGIYRVDPGSNQIARVGVPDSLTHATQLWFSSDGERLYVAQSQDELFLVHVGQPTRVERLPTSIDLENTWKIDRIAYSSRGGLAASGFQNGPRAPVIESMLLFVSEQKRFVSLVDIGPVAEGPVFSHNGSRIIAIDSSGPTLLLYHLASETYGTSPLPGEMVTFAGKDTAGDRLFLLSTRFGREQGEFEESTILLEADGVSGSTQEIATLKGVYRSGAYVEDRDMLVLTGPHFPDIRPETTDVVGMINVTFYDLSERRISAVVEVDSRLEYRDEIILQ